MAPRKRQTRFDAAYGNLEPLGFTKKVIRSKITELLKTYGGGDVGWPFIEEASYKLLIECILEDQEKEKEQLRIESGEVDETPLALGEPSVAGTSKQADEQLRIESGEVDETPLALGEPSVAGTSKQADVQLKIESGEVYETSLAPGEPSVAGTSKQADEQLKIESGVQVDERLEEDKYHLPAVDKRSLEERISAIVAAANKDRGIGCSIKNTFLEPVSPCITPDKEDECRRRKPCFGFIDCEENEEDDFVYPVTGASLRLEQTQKCSNSRKERKSRWDVQSDII